MSIALETQEGRTKAEQKKEYKEERTELSSTSRPPLESSEAFHPASLLSTFSIIGRKSFLLRALGERGKPGYLRENPCDEQPKTFAMVSAMWFG